MAHIAFAMTRRLKTICPLATEYCFAKGKNTYIYIYINLKKIYMYAFLQEVFTKRKDMFKKDFYYVISCFLLVASKQVLASNVRHTVSVLSQKLFLNSFRMNSCYIHCFPFHPCLLLFLFFILDSSVYIPGSKNSPKWAFLYKWASSTKNNPFKSPICVPSWVPLRWHMV